MHTDFTGYIDLAQVTLYLFWVFFAGLIFYLRREDKREGYPLIYDGRVGVQSGWGFPVPPGPKDYKLRDGHTATLPNVDNDRRETAIAPVYAWPGSPYAPTGNPLLDGVGPASYANRENVPEMTRNGVPTIVPLRVDGSITIEARDPDPRGFEVIGADGKVGGVITEVWVDRAEFLVRYLELEVAGSAGRRVLLPMTACRVDGKHKWVLVESILGRQFADVPQLAHPNQVTKLEEDKICGYYGGGTLYATAARQEPVL